MAFWEDVKGKVESAQTVEESAVQFIRDFVDKMEAAFNANDWQAARNLVSEADTHADEIGAAIKENTDKA